MPELFPISSPLTDHSLLIREPIRIRKHCFLLFQTLTTVSQKSDKQPSNLASTCMVMKLQTQLDTAGTVYHLVIYMQSNKFFLQLRNGWMCRVVRVLPRTKSANTACKTLMMMDRWGLKHVELTYMMNKPTVYLVGLHIYITNSNYAYSHVLEKAYHTCHMLSKYICQYK